MLVLKSQEVEMPEAKTPDIYIAPMGENASYEAAAIVADLRAGGMSLQFNLLSTDVLRDAQEHPEQYPNLQIRICGWNTLWNNVRKPEQDAFIARSESIRP